MFPFKRAYNSLQFEILHFQSKSTNVTRSLKINADSRIYTKFQWLDTFGNRHEWIFSSWRNNKSSNGILLAFICYYQWLFSAILYFCGYIHASFALFNRTPDVYLRYLDSGWVKLITAIEYITKINDCYKICII